MSNDSDDDMEVDVGDVKVKDYDGGNDAGVDGVDVDVVDEHGDDDADGENENVLFLRMTMKRWMFRKMMAMMMMMKTLKVMTM